MPPKAKPEPRVSNRKRKTASKYHDEEEKKPPNKRGSTSGKAAAAPEKKKAKTEALPAWENFDKGPPPPSIHLVTGKPFDAAGAKWREKNSSKEAALGHALYGRLAGTTKVTITTSQEIFDKLVAVKPVEPRIQTLPGRRKQEAAYDDSGEYSTPAGQIPLSRLLSLVDAPGGKVKVSPKDNTILGHLWALQFTGSSPWKRPLIRLFTHTEPVAKGKASSTTAEATSSWTITFYVYFTRLIFEMIADEDIRGVMDHLTPPGRVIPTAKLKDHPVIFTTSKPQEEEDNDFSLPGILKKAESTGYTIRDPPPSGLRVELFEYQRSTYQWMHDHERDPAGLNGYFWETWEWADGSADDCMYYFPLAGEVRLDKPPHSTGGLLCEEMGLGKTVELLAVVLGNRRPLSETKKGAASSSSLADDTPSRATLVVVPASLLGQWMTEINKVTVKGAVSCFSYPGTQQRFVDWAECRDLSNRVLAEDSHATTVLAPWTSEVEEAEEEERANPNRRLYKARVDRKFPGGQVQVTFLLEEMGDHDVVLTTYDSLRMHSALFKKIGWWRVVLDECQEIRTATTQIARMCVGLNAVHRWMMSGTPLATSIDDLNGELSFLSVWPFSLSNTTDGFWGHRVADPFTRHERRALELLTHLIKVTMIRHSKSQRYLDGRPLLTIPSRVITWHPVECGHQSERYIYAYIEHLASTECLRLSEHLETNEDAATSLTTTRGGSHAKLRALLWALQRSVTHPSLVNTQQLDALKRSLQTFHMLNVQGASGEGTIPKLRVDDVLLRLTNLGASRAGGLTRDVGRNWALGGESLLEARSKYEAFGLVELRKKITDAGLPMPMVWLNLPALGDLVKGEAVLRCWPHKDEKGKGPARGEDHHDADGDDGANKPPPPISKVMAADDLIRIGENDDQYETNVMDIGNEGQGRRAQENPRTTLVTLTRPWTSESQKAAHIYKHAPASRKRAYVDLLLAKDKEEKGLTSELHEAGFASIYRLLEGKDVTCPVCLCTLQTPTITMCCHAYCQPCIVSLIDSSNQEGQVNARCAVCRKPVTRQSLMEIDVASIETYNDAQDKDQGSNGPTDGMKEDGGGDHEEEEEEVEVLYEGKGKKRAQPSKAKGKGKASKKTTPAARNSRTGPASSSAAAAASSSNDGGGDDTNQAWDVRLPSVGFPPAADEEVLREIPDPYFHQRDPRTPSLEPSFLAHYANCHTTISSKAKAMLQDMRRQLELAPTSKFVVFSQFADAVSLLQQQLTSQGFKCVSISGHTSKIDRAKAVSAFSKGDCTVFLLTMGAGAVGLTLTAANVLYLLEPSHSLADEAQALNRAHRIGQTRPVRCTIFFVKGTVEERILAARRAEDNFLSSMDSADALTVCRSGAVDTEKGTHFSIDQLKVFFGVAGNEEEQQHSAGGGRSGSASGASGGASCSSASGSGRSGRSGSSRS